MRQNLEKLTERLQARFASYPVQVAFDEVTLEVPAADLQKVASVLHEDSQFCFEQLMDLCAVDYIHFGKDEWAGEEATNTGFSRGVEPSAAGRLKFGEADKSVKLEHPRFAVIYHLISYKNNWRLRLRVYAPDDEWPVVPTVTDVWACADWYEREAFDLFGVLFEGHPDLRRILTDYGFIGHPFRKDFPLIGNVEMRYDPEKKRVVYEPVSIEPRVLVPKVIREDNRYIDAPATVEVKK